METTTDVSHAFRLTLHSALFIRPPKQSDHNTLQTTVCLVLFSACLAGRN